MATKSTLATELKDLDVDRVDGVDRPATGRAWALFKGETKMAYTDAQVNEILKNYAAVATAADLLLKAVRKDAAGKVSKSTAIACNGMAQIMGVAPVFVHKSVPPTPYQLVTADGTSAKDDRGPADENLGSNFTPLQMLSKVAFTVKGVAAAKAGAPAVVDPEDATDQGADEGSEGKMPWMKAIKAQGEQIAALATTIKEATEGLKKAAPVAKAEEKKVVEAPASKQVDEVVTLTAEQVQVRKGQGYRFGADMTGLVFGKQGVSA